MPSVIIEKASKVLVTGANGFVAIWLVRTLLEQGYCVRGTVRSAEKGEHLTEMFKSYRDKFELVVVKDFTKDGAFDDAVRGIDAIQHIASPLHFHSDDPKELIDPAVKGTLGILKSAMKHGPAIKRVVLLASTASVLRDSDEPLVFNENDWNDQSIKEVEVLGHKASPMAKYYASKTLAEKAAWKFYSEHKDQLSWGLVTLNPPFVFGPVIHQVSFPSDLNATTKVWYDIVVAPKDSDKSHSFLTNVGSSWIDVRDLALALVKSLNVKEAEGERIIVSAGDFSWRDWLNIATSFASSLQGAMQGAPIAPRNLSRTKTQATTSAIYKIKYDTSKEKQILGLNYRTMEDAAKDTLLDYKQRGWWP
ncbi:hypothetical protein AMATHDRAFT_153481 [Amanita thiersii Skay4041]|uniref:NAD-dependent epimerase/dehydratase domain-containing protein n=1 Tax=Amanita thiersii Skay4041 TaxID=703135 RepID=A0A2A9NC43_9AGAR|nr:hypothetical protein AMATHDRAFT_153481 [Amanita thiersii Skay4041]